MTLKTVICEKLTELVTCLGNVDNLINAHVANFFTKNLWHSVIPKAVTDDLEKCASMSEFTQQYLQFIENEGSVLVFPHLPCLHDFIVGPYHVLQKTRQEVLTPVENIISELTSSDRTFPLPTIKDFMSEKKKHEVLEIVPLVALLSEKTNTDCVIDIGGGKGYLGATLASHCKMSVLSLDSSAVSTRGAAKMASKMAKHRKPGPSSRETVFVSPDLQLEPLLQKHFGNVNRAGLVGLHTCGNLATTCFEIFCKDKIRWLLNVGCCYHLITERFFTSSTWSDLEMDDDYGFPISSFLRMKKVKLGRNARMLAAHSLNRLARDGINENSAKSLMYRAVLQVLIEQARGHTLQEGNIGKLFDKCNSFHDYIRKAIQKLELKVTITDEDISQLWASHADKEAYLHTFFLLRVHFAPMIELVVLLDRLLYLYENEIENAFLVPLFDPTLSPRNHAIVAWK